MKREKDVYDFSHSGASDAQRRVDFMVNNKWIDNIVEFCDYCEGIVVL